MAVNLLCIATFLYMAVLFIRIIMSWFLPTPGTAYAQVFEAFVKVTEPVLGPVRSALPPVRMGGAALDLSPIVVFLVLIIVRKALGC
jgi:YggT family protein